jgi:hypothetical protein
MALDIIIKTIPHKDQAYETAGNYRIEADTGRIVFEISDMGNWRYEALLAIHELLEYFMVKHKKIPLHKIDAFDFLFERERLQGKYKPEEEPGNHPDAPYYFMHQIATAVERLLAGLMGINWAKYDRAVTKLQQ